MLLVFVTLFICRCFRFRQLGSFLDKIVFEDKKRRSIYLWGPLGSVAASGILEILGISAGWAYFAVIIGFLGGAQKEIGKIIDSEKNAKNAMLQNPDLRNPPNRPPMKVTIFQTEKTAAKRNIPGFGLQAHCRQLSDLL